MKQALHHIITLSQQRKWFSFSLTCQRLFKTPYKLQSDAVLLKSRKPILPSTDSTDENAQLRRLAVDGLVMRLAALERQPNTYFDGSSKQRKAYFDRLDEELDIIINMEFPGYFLIVSDFIKWAKNQKIPVGPGRGSGAGSVVAWALLITDLDPIRWGLLFERFLNPERVSMPDFDIDFCQERREEVIRYVQDKYGKDRVAQIITLESCRHVQRCVMLAGSWICRMAWSIVSPSWCQIIQLIQPLLRKIVLKMS